MAGALMMGAFCLAPDTARADNHSNDKFISFTWENDYFGGTDRNYSNGLRLAYLSETYEPGRLASWLVEDVMGAVPEDRVRYGLALGHSIYTPEDRLATEPLPDQHPYAGWLYGEASILVERDGNVLDTVVVQLGIVGPAAQGEWVQNTFHNLIDDEQLRGWDNQLENEVGLVITVDRKMRKLADIDFLGLGIDATPNFGASVGNVLTQAHMGLTLRVGQDLRDDYGPPRVRPSLAGGGFFAPQRPFAWYFFAGVEGRAVARNIFLDGNTFQDSLSVDKKPFVADAQAGFVMQIYDAQISYTFVTRTEEFETQTERQQFGAVSVALRF